MTEDGLVRPLFDDNHRYVRAHAVNRRRRAPQAPGFGYLISGAWNVFWAAFPLMYVAMGVFVMTLSSNSAIADAPPRELGLLLVILGGTVSAVMAVISLLKFLTARAIGRRTSRILCLITSGITCFALPYGTALGVATFLVLSRPSARQTFNGR